MKAARAQVVRRFRPVRDQKSLRLDRRIFETKPAATSDAAWIETLAFRALGRDRQSIHIREDVRLRAWIAGSLDAVACWVGRELLTSQSNNNGFLDYERSRLASQILSKLRWIKQQAEGDEYGHH